MATTKPSPKKAVRPFLFEESFDVAMEAKEKEAAKKEEEAPPPTFSEEELQAARDEAYRAGMQAGLEEAGASIEQQVAATLEVISGTLGQVGERQAAMNEVIARDAVDLAVAAVKKLLPATAEANGAAEVSVLVQDALTRLLQEPRVTIRVAERLTDEIERHITALAGRIGYDGKLTILADPALGPADCRILWNDGESSRDLAAVLVEIDDMVAALPRTEPDTSAVSPHAPPLGSGGPVDIEIDLDAATTAQHGRGARDRNEPPGGPADDRASGHEQTAGPA